MQGTDVLSFLFGACVVGSPVGLSSDCLRRFFGNAGLVGKNERNKMEVE